MLGLLWGGAAQAALLTFTDQALFQTAISGSPGQSTLHFEAPLAAGTTLMGYSPPGFFIFCLPSQMLRRPEETDGPDRASAYL